jgi:two-component system response regulator YesN
MRGLPMYKLMIVEDEALAREAILKMIDFKTHGFEVVAVCEDGQQAASLYDQIRPDLVITDICMPFISGLELADHIANTGRGTQVIIITGFDDFNYAKQAIKSKVTSYILKPVTPREFTEVLVEARKRLDERAEQQSQIAKAESLIHRSGQLVRDQILNRLVQGSASLDEITAEISEFGLDHRRPFFIIAIVQIDLAEQTRLKLQVTSQLLQFMVNNVVAELADAIPGFLPFQLADGRTALVGSDNDARRLSEQADRLGRLIHASLQQALKIKVTTGLGRTVASLAEVSQSFQSAQQSLGHKFRFATEPVLTPELVLQHDEAVDLTRLEDEIVRAVRLQDPAESTAGVRRLVQALPLATHSRADVQFTANRLAGRLASVVRSEPGLTPPANDFPGNAVEDSLYLDELSDWLTAHCLACIGQLSMLRNRDGQRLSIRALQYLQDHFADSQLSLMAVCNHLSVSLSHFSQVFKEETGKTFVEALTEIRMEKAKELLRSTNRMLYDIAEQVGYDNQAYFTVTFKKHVGLNPREYRKQFSQGV